MHFRRGKEQPRSDNKLLNVFVHLISRSLLTCYFTIGYSKGWALICQGKNLANICSYLANNKAAKPET